MSTLAETPYSAVDTVRHKNNIASARMQASRRQGLNVGDKIVYDPRHPTDIAPSWRARIGKVGVITAIVEGGKPLCTFEGSDLRELRPSHKNFYVIGKWFEQISWEV